MGIQTITLRIIPSAGVISDVNTLLPQIKG